MGMSPHKRTSVVWAMMSAFEGRATSAKVIRMDLAASSRSVDAAQISSVPSGGLDVPVSYLAAWSTRGLGICVESKIDATNSASTASDIQLEALG